jgi:N-acetyltransferase
MELVFNDPLILKDGELILRPLEWSDRDGMAAFAFDRDLWTHSVYSILSFEDLDWFIGISLSARDAGLRYPLAIVLDNAVVGTTSLGTFSSKNCKLEIGWTWIAKQFHGSGLNSRVKSLLINHVFSYMNCQRIEFQTDTRNQRARKAIEKLGASLEGVLRSHLVRADGSRRDSAVYSILKDEWLESILQPNTVAPFPSLNAS